MLAEIERGADAVGGIPSTALKGAGLLPHIRATVKLPMIVMKRTLQQLLGGAPFIISGACGMFRTDVLRKFGFSDRTKVEDLDLTDISGKRLPYSAGESLHRIPTGMQQSA